MFTEIQLDQDGLVNTIINLLTKMNNESERFAEIMVGANRHSFEQMGMDPEEMKREMADSMKDMPVPTREEVQAVMSLVEVKDFTFEYSLLPGGPKKFNVDLGFNAPDDSAKGSLAFSMDMAGKQNNLQGSYRLAGGFSAVDGPGIDFATERRLTVPPFVEAGTAMVPLEFVIDHIGAGLTFADRSLVITN